MQRLLLILSSTLIALLAEPGLQTGWAVDAPWMSKGGSYDACLLRSSQSLNQERLANIGFGLFRGAMDSDCEVMVGCLRTNLRIGQSGESSNRLPKGKLSYIIATDWLSRFNDVGEQGRVKFKEKKDAARGIRFGSKRVKVPTGYEDWTQYIQSDFELDGRDLLLGWSVTGKGKAKAGRIVNRYSGSLLDAVF